MEEFFKKISVTLGEEINLKPALLFDKFISREREATTLVRKGLAIPHIGIEGKNIVKAIIVRARAGIIFPDDQVAHIVFVLVGSVDERIFHLKILAAIAQITQNPDFDNKWMEAKNEEELRSIILLAERKRDKKL